MSRRRVQLHDTFRKPLYLALGFIIFIGLLTWLFISFDTPRWTLFSIIVGVFTGVPGSYLIQQKMADKYKFSTVGALGGMGLDLGAAVSDQAANHTFIHSVSQFITGIITSLVNQDQKVIPNLETYVMIGIWSFIGLVALVLIFSLILDKEHKPK